MNVSTGRYALGVVCVLIVCGSMAVAAVALRRRFFAGACGAVARLAEALLGFALLVALLELLGAIGLFYLAPVAVGSAVVGLGAIVFWGGPMRSARTRDARGVRPASAVTVAVIAVSSLLFAEWASPALQAYDHGIRVVDSVWYHMPWAAAFAQTGHVTPLHFTDVEFLTAFYPATTEMLHGLGIVLLGRDTLSPGLNLIFLGLALLAAYCVGRRRGAGAASLAGAAIVMATPMMVLSQPGSADNDVVGVFLLLGSVALLLVDEESPSCWVLAAVAAGLAAAIKLTFLAPVGALTLGALVIARSWRARLAWAISLVLAGGFWYVRNLIAVGNPLPWTSLGIFPTPAPPEAKGKTFAIAHYLFSGRVWRHFAEPAFASGLGSWWWAIVAVALIGPVLCLLPGAGRTLRMLALVALVSLGAYLVTPNSAMGPAGDPVGIAYNVRYAAPGLALSLALLPLAPLFAGERRQLALLGGLAAILVATLARGSFWPAKHAGGAVVLAVVVAAVLLAVSLRPGRRAIPLAVGGLLVLAGAAGGYSWQRHYLRGRYAFNPGVSYLAHVWAFFRTVHHARVALAGTYGSYFGYPLYGVDDSNRVRYVALRGPHGSFTAIKSCRQWRSALNAGRFRYVVTTPNRDFWVPKHLTFSPEGRWTASDPAARVVLSRRAVGQRITVYELTGPLSPTGCG